MRRGTTERATSGISVRLVSEHFLPGASVPARNRNIMVSLTKTHWISEDWIDTDGLSTNRQFLG
jgi:hypothetical protein